MTIVFRIALALFVSFSAYGEDDFLIPTLTDWTVNEEFVFPTFYDWNSFTIWQPGSSSSFKAYAQGLACEASSEDEQGNKVVLAKILLRFENGTLSFPVEGGESEEPVQGFFSEKSFTEKSKLRIQWSSVKSNGLKYKVVVIDRANTAQLKIGENTYDLDKCLFKNTSPYNLDIRDTMGGFW